MSPRELQEIRLQIAGARHALQVAVGASRPYIWRGFILDAIRDLEAAEVRLAKAQCHAFDSA